MGSVQTARHADHAAAELVVDETETAVHLLLGDEGLDDAQAAQGLLNLCHDLAQSGLNVDGLILQLLAHGTHDEDGGNGHEEHEQRELPADGEERREADDDGDGLADEVVHTAGNGTLHHLYVGAHADDDVALALRAEEAQRQAQNLVVELGTDVAYDTRGERHHDVHGGPVARTLDDRHDDEQYAHDAQRDEGTIRRNQFLHPGIAVVDDDLLVQRTPRPLLVGIYRLVYLEQDVQDRNQHDEGEHVHPLGEDVQEDGTHDVHPVRIHIAPQHLEELFKHVVYVLPAKIRIKNEYLAILPFFSS